MAIISVPRIYNKTLTLANTEYSQALGGYASKFMIQCRNLADIKVAFVENASGTTYFTIPAGASFSENVFFAGIKTIYIQSVQAGAVVEILEWT